METRLGRRGEPIPREVEAQRPPRCKREARMHFECQIWNMIGAIFQIYSCIDTVLFRVCRF